MRKEVDQLLQELETTAVNMKAANETLDKVNNTLEQSNQAMNRLASIIVTQQAVIASSILRLFSKPPNTLEPDDLYHIEALRSVLQHSQQFLKQVGLIKE